jgi:hypothetical protein
MMNPTKTLNPLRTPLSAFGDAHSANIQPPQPGLVGAEGFKVAGEIALSVLLRGVNARCLVVTGLH